MPDASDSQQHVSVLELGALTEAVPCARLHARALMQEWGLDPVARTVELITSEFVTNAIRASRRNAGLAAPRHDGQSSSHSHDGRPAEQGGDAQRPERRAGLPVVALRLSADDDHVVIEVWDEVATGPRLTSSQLNAESGRGLALVEAFSERWGWYAPGNGTGKVVWAQVTHGSKLRRAQARAPHAPGRTPSDLPAIP